MLKWKGALRCNDIYRDRSTDRKAVSPAACPVIVFRDLPRVKRVQESDLDWIIEIIKEEKLLEVSETYKPIIRDLWDKVFGSPTERKLEASDHILITGSNRKETSDFLFVIEIILRERLYTVPIANDAHNPFIYDCNKHKITALEWLRNPYPAIPPYNYLMIHNLHSFPLEHENLLEYIMDTMRVVCTASTSKLNQIPGEILQEFPIIVNIDEFQIMHHSTGEPKQHDRGKKLETIKAIANHLECSPSLIKIMKREKGFPLTRQQGKIICYSNEIDTYYRKRKEKDKRKI